MILGSQTRIFMARETTWGSTPTFDTAGENLWYDYELYVRPGSRPRRPANNILNPIMSSGGSLHANSYVEGMSMVDGSYSMYLATHGMQNIIFLATGDRAATPLIEEDPDTTENTSTSVGTYSKVVAKTKNSGATNTDSDPDIYPGEDWELPSCSIFHAFDKSGNNFSGSVLAGMMLNQMSINCAGEDSLVELSASFLGKSETWVTNGANNYNSGYLERSHLPGEYFVGWQARLSMADAGTITANDGDWSSTPFYNFAMTHNNNLNFTGFISGTNSTTKPHRTDLRDVSGNFTLAFSGNSDFAAPTSADTDGIINAVLNSTPRAIKLEFSRYNNQVAGKARSEYFTIMFPSVVFTGEGSPSSIDDGVIRLPVAFRATSHQTGGVDISDVIYEFEAGHIA